MPLIGFVLRTVFWLGLVLVMLPGEDGVIAADHALRRLQEAGGDAAGLIELCSRQPDLCRTMGRIASGGMSSSPATEE